MMKKIMIATLLAISVTALPSIAANDNSGINETLSKEQVQQDMKRKEMLDGMQMQAQKRKQQLEQQSAEIKGQQEWLVPCNNHDFG